MTSSGFLCALFAQANPFSEGTNDMVRAGHTMVFLAFVIAAVGIGFRVYFANKRRSNRAQGQMQMPWTPPPPTYPPPQPHGHECTRINDLFSFVLIRVQSWPPAHISTDTIGRWPAVCAVS